MQKSQLAWFVQKELQISDKEYKKALEVIFNKIADALIKREKVVIRDFGILIVKYHKPRKGVNPQTGCPLNIPEKWVIKFNACKALKEKVNKKR